MVCHEFILNGKVDGSESIVFNLKWEVTRSLGQNIDVDGCYWIIYKFKNISSTETMLFLLQLFYVTFFAFTVTNIAKS